MSFIEKHTFQGGFTPESVLVSGATIAGAMVAGGFALAGGGVGGVGDDAAAKAIAFAVLVVAMTILVAIIAGIMDKRKKVRYGSIAGAVAVLGLVAAGVQHYRRRRAAGDSYASL